MALSIVAALGALFGWKTTQDQAHVAMIRLWLMASVDRQPDVGILLAAQALKQAPPSVILEARDTLLKVMLSARAVAPKSDEGFNGHTESISGMSFSADGSLLATASWDNTLRIWNTKQENSFMKLDYASGKYGFVIKGAHQETQISADSGPIKAILFSQKKQKID